jgi:hypothetical protein
MNTGKIVLLGFWERGAQNRGKERHLVDPAASQWA